MHETDRLKAAWGKLLYYTGTLNDHPLQDSELMRIGREVSRAMIRNVSFSAALNIQKSGSDIHAGIFACFAS